MIVGLFYWILYSVIIIVCMQDGSAVLIRDIVLLWLFCNSNLPVYFDHFFGFLWGLENILNSSLSFKLDCVSGISGGKGEGGKRKRERAWYSGYLGHRFSHAWVTCGDAVSFVICHVTLSNHSLLRAAQKIAGINSQTLHGPFGEYVAWILDKLIVLCGKNLSLSLLS